MIGISAFKALPEIPEKALENGYKLEFTGLVEPSFYSEEFLSNTRKLTYFQSIQSVHGPFYDLVCGSFDIEVAELAFNKFRRAISACSSLEIKKIVFHTGWIPGFYSDEKWLSSSIRFWKAFMVTVPEDITVCIENNLERFPYLIKDIIQAVDSRNLRACLDVGHVNVHSKDSIQTWIQSLGTLVDHVHLHNNFGDSDSHNGLLKGTIKMPEVLDLLNTIENPSMTWNMELRNEIDESIRFMNSYRRNA